MSKGKIRNLSSHLSVKRTRNMPLFVNITHTYKPFHTYIKYSQKRSQTLIFLVYVSINYCWDIQKKVNSSNRFQIFKSWSITQPKCSVTMDFYVQHIILTFYNTGFMK